MKRLFCAVLVSFFSLAYRLCLRLLPRAFRLRHRAAMRDTFEDALDDTARRASIARVLATGTGECFDAVRQGLSLHRGESRRSRPVLPETLLGDLRVCARAIPRRHSLSVIVALALGIGATTAVFSLVDTVLLRPLPYPDADRLVRIGSVRLRSDAVGALSPPLLSAILERFAGFEKAAASTGSWVTLTGSGRPQRLRAAWVSGEFFALLGGEAERGRLLGPAEDSTTAPPAVVLGHDSWQRRFAGSRSVLGTTLTVEGRGYTVIGVLGPDFVSPEGNRMSGTYDLWLPLAWADAMAEPGLAFLDAFGRLAADTTTARAATEADALGRALAGELELSERAFMTLQIAPLREQTIGGIANTLWTLMGAVALLLVIACSNVASLMLTRAAERQPEIALRAALGAGAGRIARLVLLESTLLAILGGAGGAALAYIAVGALRSFSPAKIPRLAEVVIDGRVLLFALAVSTATGMVAGLLPALRAHRTDPRCALGPGGRNVSRDRHQGAMARVFVVTQTALALVLLIGAGLLLHSFVRLNRVDLGFDASGLMRMQVNLGSVLDGSDEMQRARVAFFDSLRRRVAEIPGVRHAHLTTGAPFSAGGWYSSITVVGRPEGAPSGPGAEVQAYRHQVSGGHLSGLGLNVLQGREITDEDGEGTLPMVVVNEALARRYWPDGDALGSQVIIGGDGTFTPRTVVGIVSNARYHELEADDDPHIYMPFEQFPAFAMDVVARFEGEPASIAAAMREAVWSLRDDLAIRDVSTMRELVYADLVEPGFYTWLLASFAGVALLLSGIGVYGSVAHSTAMRTREIGTRIAVGAQPTEAVAMVLRSAVGTMTAGIAIGLGGAYATTRFLSGFLYEVETTDGIAYASAALAVALLGLLAAYIPARKAAHVDPIIALRSD